MSRQIDPYNLDDDDLEYLKQRPLIRQELVMQGFGDPLKVEHSVDPTTGKSTPKLVRNEDYNPTGDGELEGQSDGDEGFQTPQTPGEEHWSLEKLPDNQQWNDGMNKSDLNSVISARNAAREGEGSEDLQKVEPSGDTKADLVSALEADDQWLTVYMNEDNDED